MRRRTRSDALHHVKCRAKRLMVRGSFNTYRLNTIRGTDDPAFPARGEGYPRRKSRSKRRGSPPATRPFHTRCFRPVRSNVTEVHANLESQGLARSSATSSTASASRDSPIDGPEVTYSWGIRTWAPIASKVSVTVTSSSSSPGTPGIAVQDLYTFISGSISLSIVSHDSHRVNFCLPFAEQGNVLSWGAQSWASAL